MRHFREVLPRRFPGVEFFFQPADMVTQILNFGLPAPLDVQVVGTDMYTNYGSPSRSRTGYGIYPARPTYTSSNYFPCQLAYGYRPTRVTQVGLTAAERGAKRACFSSAGVFRLRRTSG